MNRSVLSIVLIIFGLRYGLTIQQFLNYPKEPLVPPRKSNAKVETYHVTQQVDHFDEENTDTWDMVSTCNTQKSAFKIIVIFQKYFVNSEHYVSGGPIFIFVGGEWAITKGWLRGGLMYDMAEELHGYMVYTEHRFYGTSHPTT
jgi:hypothetical protein